MCLCPSAYANDWIPAQPFVPVPPVAQYYYTTQTVVVPVFPMFQPIVYYAPVTTYQNIIVEKKQWCLLKRYEIVPTYQTVYIPFRY